MNKTQIEFQNLIKITLEYIESEYEHGTKLFCTTETYSFFENSTKNVNTKIQHTPENKPIIPLSEIIQETSKLAKAEKEKATLEPKEDSKNKPPHALLPTSPLPKPTLEFSEEIKKRIEKIFPNIKIVKDIPSDEEAKILSEQWQKRTQNAAVLIFNFSPTPEHAFFWENVKRAIEGHFSSCCVIEAQEWEKKNNWDSFFKLYKPNLILGTQEIFKNNHLLTHFKEIPSSKERFLHSQKYLTTHSAAEYIKNPNLKKSLWSMICKHLRQD
ncbi:MAG: hypothetical protein FJZ57_00100 [Chlamydiae bacterium]|nr:hypothetical protein [Chlamydiota bacterium]